MSSSGPAPNLVSPQLRTSAKDQGWQRPRWLGGVIGASLLVVFWELMSTVTFGGRHVIPTPQAVIATIFHDPGYSVWANLGVTAPEAGLGWLSGNLVALALAGLFILLPVTEAPLLKLALASYCVPITAIGAIFYVVLPTGDDPRIAVSALAVIFTTLMGALMGLRSADKTSLDLVRAFGGGRWAQLVKVQFRSALPSTFAGLSIAGPASVLGAIIGEYLGGQDGLGTTMVLAQQAMDIRRVWAIAVVATALAGAAFLVTTLVGRLLTPWAPRASARR
jgi:ABC-type nitrate/sulfonate/bicarbonate transport system permease component